MPDRSFLDTRSLFSVNRQIHAESSYVFYTTCSFVFLTPAAFFHFTSKVSSPHLALIRRISFTIEGPESNDRASKILSAVATEVVEKLSGLVRIHFTMYSGGKRLRTQRSTLYKEEIGKSRVLANLRQATFEYVCQGYLFVDRYLAYFDHAQNADRASQQLGECKDIIAGKDQETEYFGEIE